LRDVIEHCWVGDPPENPRIAHEVKMAKFGMVDFVIADVDESTNRVKEFVSVELQAVDITGSVEPAYQAVLNSVSDFHWPKGKSYGVNWANVRKRYIQQLITKGFFHHHWGTRIISVIQLPLYDYFMKSIGFDELSPGEKCNVIFMCYDYEPAPDKGPLAHKMVLKKVVGTSHNSLMMGPLYRTPPSRDDFCDRIKGRL